MIKKEQYEWIDAWQDDADRTDLPRVLLIGDSITRGYNGRVREFLKGIAYVDFIATSYAIDNPLYVALVKKYAEAGGYSLIHFNHGLHGYHMGRRTYLSKTDKLIKALAKDAKIIIATSTIVYKEGNKGINRGWAKRLEERNGAVKELADKNGYKLNDLYSVSEKLDVSLRLPDGVHYNEQGYNVLGKVVADNIKELL